MLIAAITLLLLGTALATGGLIGRRLGDELRCRKCKYNLTGVESKECPECGRAWTPETAARGLRTRRRRSLGIGTTMLLVGALLLTPAAQRKVGGVNWFTYLPTDWVLPAATRGSSDALSVLVKRHARGKLSPEHIQSMIESGLRLQCSPTLLANTQSWVDWLGRLFQRQVLSDTQMRRFLDQSVAITVHVRPGIRAPDPLPFEMVEVLRIPSSGFYARISIEDLAVDGRRAAYMGADLTQWLPSPSCGTVLRRSAIAPMTLAAGRHRLSFALQIAASPNWPATQSQADRRIPFSTEFEVIAGDAIEVQTDTETGVLLARIIRASATLIPLPSTASAHSPTAATEWSGYLSTTFDLSEPSPIDGIFEATALAANGDAFDCGRFSITKGDRVIRPFPDPAATTPSPTLTPTTIRTGEEFRIQLRFRAAYAYETTTITRTWDGFFVMGPIKAEPPAPGWSPVAVGSGT